MFSRILSSTIAAMAIVAAAPSFAADPFDGPGWEPAIVDDTTAAPVPNGAMPCAEGAADHDKAAPIPKDAMACVGGAAEQNKAPSAREETGAKAKGAYDPFNRSQDFGG